MPIVVQCTTFSTKYKFADSAAGKQMKCKNCGQVLRVSSGGAKSSKPKHNANKDDDFLSGLAEVESAGERVEEADLKMPRLRAGASRSGSKSSKKPNAKSGMPPAVIAGGAALAALLVAGVAFFLFSGSKEKAPAAGNAIADSVPPKAANQGAASGAQQRPAVAAAQPKPAGSGAGNDAQRYPRLPDGVSQSPDWLAGNTPFDLAKYFEALPFDQNAAPLYLDAIFEFASVVKSCFPDDPQRAQRVQAADERMQRYTALSQQPRSPATAAQWDALLRDYELGFEKVALAQQRPECVFETGLDITALLPQVQGMRQISRMATERTRRDLENGDFSRPIATVAMCLRLSRDARSRGFSIAQLVSMALDSICYNDIVRILSTPGVKPEHCDQLLALLKQHDEQSKDQVPAAAQSEYLMQRMTVREIQIPEERRRLKDAVGAKDDSIAAILATFAGSNGKLSDTDVQKLSQLPAKFDERPEIAELDEQYRAVVSMGGKPYRERAAAWTKYVASLKQILPKLLAPNWNQMFEADTLSAARRHGTQALVALRRWQLTHAEPPRDLAQVMTDIRVDAVPRDDYGDGPLKLATINGEVVVYSVGPDGIDDGARVEWLSAPNQPGDFVFHMSPRPID